MTTWLLAYGCSPLDRLTTSRTINGTTSQQVWNLAGGLPTVIQNGTTKYVTGPGGLPIEQIASNGTVLYYLQDQLGSTRALLDGTKTTQATYSYGAYGNLASHTGAITNREQHAADPRLGPGHRALIGARSRNCLPAALARP